jgi:hypothetical protein
MTTPLFTINTLPATSQAAIREFDDRYLASIGATPPTNWTDLGDLLDVNQPMVTFPVSSFALKYQQTQGENRFKTMAEKSFDVKVQELDAGYEGNLLDLLTKTFAYRNWLEGPRRLMYAEGRHRNEQIATLLDTGEATTWPIDGANFFSATHLSDFNDTDSATWSNYQAAATPVTSIVNIEQEVTSFQGVLDENGAELGADPDTILVPTAKYEAVKNLLAQAMILDSTGAAGVTNPYQGKFRVVRVPELTDADQWYLVDSKLLASSGLAPWLSLRYATPQSSGLALRWYDEASDFFKDTGKIKASSHIWYGFSLGFPHAIRKVEGV